jgi:cytochrome oxidase Cu insertion factor (SCO1/SenC/PrrC family)
MIRKALSAAALFALSLGCAGAQPTQPQGAQPAQASQPAPAQTAQPAPPQTHLKVGQPAPDFTLRDTTGKEVKLSDFKGKKSVVLAFYVLAFTGG